jgi:hypothetical protein
MLRVFADVGRLASLVLQSHATLAAENLFLRKQLALYLERQVKPRRAEDATRITLVALSRLVEWRRLLVIVKPDTLIRWCRSRIPRSCGGWEFDEVATMGDPAHAIQIGGNDLASAGERQRRVAGQGSIAARTSL